MYGSAYKCFVDHAMPKSVQETIFERNKRYREKLEACDNCGEMIKRGSKPRHRAQCTSVGYVYQCQEGCDKKFRTEGDRRTHHKNSHREPLRSCPYEGCGLLLKKKSYKSHIESIHEQIKSRCKYCNEEVIKHYMNSHYMRCFVKQSIKPSRIYVREKKVYEKKHKCRFEGCTVAFPHPSGLIRHEQRVHGMKHKNMTKICPTCKDEVGAKIFKQHHDKCTFNGQRMFVCESDGCSKSFVTKYDLKSHIRNIHINQPTVVCPIEGCGLMCRPHRVKSHVDRTHLNPFATCDKCGGEVRKSSFSNHKKRCRGAEKPKKLLECPVEGCLSKMASCRIKDHVSVAHNRDTSECQKCLKSFLPEHLAEHSGTCKKLKKKEPQVTCYHCGRTMKKCSLYEHIQKYCRRAIEDMGLAPKEFAQCNYCRREMPKSTLLKHFSYCVKADDSVRHLYSEAQCTFQPKKNRRLQCDYCRKELLRVSMYYHVLYYCEKARRQGINSFNMPEKIKALMNEARQITCEHCWRAIPVIALTEHLKMCKAQLKWVKCKPCGLRLPENSLPGHSLTCIARNTQSTNEPERAERDSSPMVEREPQRITCDDCGKSILGCNWSRHRKGCTMKLKPVQCNDCGQAMKKNNLLRHFEKTCPGKNVVTSAPSSKICKIQIKRLNFFNYLKTSHESVQGSTPNLLKKSTKKRNLRNKTVPREATCYHCSKSMSKRGLTRHLKYCPEYLMQINVPTSCEIIKEVIFSPGEVEVKAEVPNPEPSNIVNVSDILPFKHEELEVIDEYKPEPL